MSKAEGKIIAIEFDNPLTGPIENNEAAFTVTGQEYQYTGGPGNNGPMINRVYTVEKVSKHETMTNAITIYINDTLANHNKKSFRNTKNLKVIYNPALGNLAGLSGPVEGFELEFIPVDLVERGNYGHNTNISADIGVTFAVKRVYYSSYGIKENISAGINSVTFEVTKVGNNPL